MTRRYAATFANPRRLGLCQVCGLRYAQQVLGGLAACNVCVDEARRDAARAVSAAAGQSRPPDKRTRAIATIARARGSRGGA
ncbi:MAG TPA: hypothetical protein VN253_07770 [Kofleriaceae bacterium]|nr:hypothetical protein [Kofleriaceae bacterium]